MIDFGVQVSDRGWIIRYLGLDAGRNERGLNAHDASKANIEVDSLTIVPVNPSAQVIRANKSVNPVMVTEVNPSSEVFTIALEACVM